MPMFYKMKVGDVLKVGDDVEIRMTGTPCGRTRTEISVTRGPGVWLEYVKVGDRADPVKVGDSFKSLTDLPG